MYRLADDFAPGDRPEDKCDFINQDDLIEALDIIFDKVHQSENFGIDETKGALLAKLLERVGNVSKVSRIADIGRSTLYRKMQDHADLFRAAAAGRLPSADTEYEQALDKICTAIIGKRITLKGVEEKFLQFMLDSTHKMSEGASMLGISRTTFYRKASELQAKPENSL